MSTTWIRTAAVVALAAASLQAHAATVSVTLTDWAFKTGNTVNTTWLSVDGTKITSKTYSGPAGAFTGALSGPGTAKIDPFVTYCIELEQFFSFSKTPMENYTVVEGGTYFGDPRGVAGKAERLGRLLTFVSENSGLVDDAAKSTSMQLAVWNIVYDDDWSVSDGTGFRDISGFAKYANTLLTGAQGVAASSFNVFALERDGKQDFLLATQRPATSSNSSGNQVPEPASLALVAVALAGLGVARRRSVSRVGAAAA